MRTPTRAVLGILLALVPLAAQSQGRQGVYKTSGGGSASWSINESHTLIWDGKPYLPIGVRIDGTPGAVTAAKAAGLRDVIVDLPANGAGWTETLAALNDAKINFLLRVDSLAPMAKGFAVEPQAYRITGITAPRTVTVALPGATSAFVVLASRRDSSIASSSRVPVVNGQLTYNAKPAGELEHVLLIYPETSSLEQPDYWETMDTHRDALLGSLKRHNLGAGLRGIVDPLGRTVGLPGKDFQFVPTSDYFHLEFRDYLENQYHSLKTAMQTWAMGTNDLETFDDLARLVPLWQGSRGVPLLLDPKTNKTYPADLNHSKIWRDMADAVNAAGARRFSRFVASVRSVADVPVVQEWAGWAVAYETNTPALDGVAMKAAGTGPQSLIDTASRASSSAVRWPTASWIPATDIDLGEGENTPAQIPAVVDDLGSLGARAFFIRASSPAVVKAVVAEADKRKDDVSLSSAPFKALFYPENATNPANPQKLPFSLWWLPCPLDGNRIDLGTLFYGYRMQSPKGNTVVLWAKNPGRYRLRMLNPKTVAFQATDGHDPDPKLTKGGVDVNLSDMPMVITGTNEIPIPDLALAETMFRFEFMMGMASKSMRDITEERIYFKDQVMAFDRNPGGSFPLMRMQLAHLASKVGDVSIAEGEKCYDTNFSQIETDPGCSMGGALVLHTPLPPEPGGYYAQFTMQSKSRSDQEVWLAASIPLERRGDVTVSVNGQVMLLTGDPVGNYGDGFGWYKLGVTKLAADPAKVRIQVNGPAASPIAIDAIVMTPRPFTPTGPDMPDAVIFPPMPKK